MRTMLTGMDVLVAEPPSWLRAGRFGLVTHAAAVDVQGRPSVELLAGAGLRPALLLTPEHGYWGVAGAGEAVPDARHAEWGLALHSLYGAVRAPADAVLDGLEGLVVDLQDLGARCYTYLATLRGVLEAAARRPLYVVVTDRPIPLPDSMDGPVTEPGYESFVAPVRVPLAYGMTPAEAARWMVAVLGLSLDLHTIPMQGYRRGMARGPGWPEWMPPSPAITTWESAACYLVTVFTEAFPALDAGRQGPLAFRVLGGPGLPAAPLLETLRSADLPGVRFYTHVFRAGDKVVEGIRIAVSDPGVFQPATVAVHILAAVRDSVGAEWLWKHPEARPDFFDRLMGSPVVRRSLERGAAAADIVEAWQEGLQRFGDERRSCLLYR